MGSILCFVASELTKFELLALDAGLSFDGVVSEEQKLRKIRELADHRDMPRRSLFESTHTVSYEHEQVGHHSILYEHVEELRNTFGEGILVGDVAHSPLWTGYSIRVNAQYLISRTGSREGMMDWLSDALRGDGGRFKRSASAEKLDRILRTMPKMVGEDVISEIVLSYIRALPGIRTVHKSRSIRAYGEEESGEGNIRRDDILRGAANTELFAEAIKKATSYNENSSGTGSGSDKKRAVPLPWGLDRLDQQSLPLDGKYDPIFTGMYVNAFIVDSGLDTRHVEFADGQAWVEEQQQQQQGGTGGSGSQSGQSSFSGRTVRNLYDVYAGEDMYAKTGDLEYLDDDDMSFFPPRNNDLVGHGTHCAGTIGGTNVGVSPNANLYGVRVLNSQGSGDREHSPGPLFACGISRTACLRQSSICLSAAPVLLSSAR